MGAGRGGETQGQARLRGAGRGNQRLPQPEEAPDTTGVDREGNRGAAAEGRSSRRGKASAL